MTPVALGWWVARALTATALLAAIFGFGRSWLPRVGWLAAALVALHLVTFLRPRHIAAFARGARARWFAVALALTVLLAVCVRVPGYSGDLGNAPLDIDEHRLAVNVKHYFSTGELGHETVEHYPGAVFWLFSGASFVSYVHSLASGVPERPAALPAEFYVHAARTANIVVAAAIVLITGLLGRRIGGPLAGVLSALVVAIVPLSVETTVLVRNDPGMVLAVTAAVYVSLVFRDTGRLAWAAAAGLVVGVAIAIKYSSVFALVPALSAAAACRGSRDRVKGVLVVLAACTLAVAVTNHFIWADVPNFLRQLAEQVGITGRGHYAASDNPAAAYVDILVRFGPGLPLLLLAGAFAVHALATRTLDGWMLVSFPLLYVWFMTQRPAQFPRWVFPVVPFVAIAGMSALVAAVQTTGAFARSRPRGIRTPAYLVAAALVIVSLWPPLRAGAVTFSKRVTPMTHAATIAWMSRNLPPGSAVLAERHWLDLRGLPLEVHRVDDLRLSLDEGIQGLAAYDYVVVPEIHFGHPTLRRLGFMHRVHAEQGFGGSLGHDYEIYAVPRVPGAGAR
jgi:4-amino-4-deoxy-L-arabinose transferase-like glycosyltransferase